MSEGLEKVSEQEITKETEDATNNDTQQNDNNKSDDTYTKVSFDDKELELIEAYRNNDFESINAILGREPESKSEDVESSHSNKFGFDINETIPEDIRDSFEKFSEHELWKEIQDLANPEDLGKYAKELSIDMKRDDFNEILELAESLRPTKKLMLDAYLEASKTVAERARLKESNSNVSSENDSESDDEWMHLSGEARREAFRKALKRKGID